MLLDSQVSDHKKLPFGNSSCTNTWMHTHKHYRCTLTLSWVCVGVNCCSCLQEKAISIWESKDFFTELEPLPGGVEAVKEMAKMEKYVGLDMQLTHLLQMTGFQTKSSWKVCLFRKYQNKAEWLIAEHEELILCLSCMTCRSIGRKRWISIYLCLATWWEPWILKRWWIVLPGNWWGRNTVYVWHKLTLTACFWKFKEHFKSSSGFVIGSFVISYIEVQMNKDCVALLRL